MSKYLSAPVATEKMPKGIPYIIGNELAERFSFYGMKCILMIFMTKHLMDSSGALAPMGREDATYWYHMFTSAVYFTPLLGAIVADAFFGKYKTILSLSIVYCLGHIALALDETRLGLSVGLTLIAIGAGGIKPCVSAHVGDQFGKTNSHLLEKVFSWFYLSINLGAFISTLLTPIMLEKFGPSVAFGIPGALMIMATYVFYLGRNEFIHIQPTSSVSSLTKSIKNIFNLELFKNLSLNISQGISLLLIIFLFRYFLTNFISPTSSTVISIIFGLFYLIILAVQQKSEIFEGFGAIIKLSIIYSFVAVFWALFDQTGSTWVLQAESLNRNWLGMEWLSSQIQAINPIMILLFVPLFSYVIYPALGKVMDLSPIKKINLGFFLAVPSFVIIGLVQSWIDAGQTPSIGWQIGAYAILTAAEVLVSITCLEFSYTQAPNSMKSLIMGFFMLSVSLGNIFTAGVNAFIQNPDGTSKLEGASYFYFFAGIMLATAVLFILVTIFYKPKEYLQEEK